MIKKFANWLLSFCSEKYKVSYVITQYKDGQRSIRCGRNGIESFSQKDIEEKYCHFHHMFFNEGLHYRAQKTNPSQYSK